MVALAWGCAGVEERERLFGLGRVEDMIAAVEVDCVGDVLDEGLIWID
jgi:hypothetical protein